MISKLMGQQMTVVALQLDSSGQHLRSMGYEGTILVHSTADWSVVGTIGARDVRPLAFALSYDGNRLGMTFDGGAAVYSTDPFSLGILREMIQNQARWTEADLRLLKLL